MTRYPYCSHPRCSKRVDKPGTGIYAKNRFWCSKSCLADYLIYVAGWVDKECDTDGEKT